MERHRSGCPYFFSGAGKKDVRCKKDSKVNNNRMPVFNLMWIFIMIFVISSAGIMIVVSTHIGQDPGCEHVACE